MLSKKVEKIMAERQNDYGDFYYNFMTIGKIWGALLGVGEISILGLCYTLSVTIAVFFIGLLVFNKTEKTFIDTV